MASLKFYLRDKTAKEKTSIFFLLNYGAFELVNGKKKYLPLKYFTNESINPEYWDKDNGKVKGTSKFPQHPEFNARLKDIENTATKILLRLQNEGITLTNDILKTEFDNIWKEGKNQTVEAVLATMEFNEFIEHYIKTNNNKETTKKSYRRAFKDIQEYQKIKKKHLTFAKIDIDFYNDFITFLKGKKYAPNTIGTRIKNLKSFLSNAQERGLIVNEDYKKKSFMKPKEETDAVYLSETELKKIYALDLSNKPKLDRVRDLFLIGCYTGLRFSDLSTLSADNIGNDNTISIRTIKTDAEVTIPIHPIVRDILKKYEYHLPKMLSNQKFNEYVKDVAKLAELNEPVNIEHTKGNLRVKKALPKYELTTSHTARRSFATNAYLNDVPSISIMKITGHKTESAFMRYIKISQKDNARKLQEHPFFHPMVVSK